MRKGTYQLLIRLDHDETITVGKLGVFHFPSGYYIYTGSAMGGLDARIAHHLSRSYYSPQSFASSISDANGILSRIIRARTNRFHWHIDFLLERSSIIRYATREDTIRRECEMNSKTLAMDGATVPVAGFGASDCKCVSHLIYFKVEPLILPVEESEGNSK